MKTKIISCIFFMAFLLTAVHCKPPTLPSPPRPMTPTERIFGVFQTIRGDIISLNNGEFYMIGDGLLASELDYSAVNMGRYSINELGILELHRSDGIMRLQIERDENRQIISLMEPLTTRLIFINIVSEEQYNDSISNELGGEYRSLDDDRNYFLNLNSYRVSTFNSPDFTRSSSRSIGGYYIDNDNNLRVISDRGSMSFTIIRNSSGQISSLRHRVREGYIPLAREGFTYSADELTMLSRNIIGRAFQANLSNGQSFEIISQNSFELPYVIEGEPINMNFQQQEIRIAVQNHGFNYNGDYLFRLVLRPGSRTEIDRFEALSPDCPIRSLTRIFRE